MECKIVVGSAAADHVGYVAYRNGVVFRLFRDDVDGSGYGIRPEKGRSSTTHHLYPLDHVGRYLFNAVYSGQGTEYGAAVDKNLRVGTVQSIDTNLLEPAVLAVAFEP